jgi:hypothetical protein
VPDPSNEAPFAEDSGEGLERALRTGLRVAELYACTLFVALILPWRLLHYLSGPVPPAKTDEQSRFLGPLTFLAITWLLSNALNNLLLSRVSAAQLAGADLPTLKGHGVPLTELVIWTLPLMLVVRIGASVAASICHRDEDKPRVFALNCYLVALLLVLALLINLLSLRREPAPRQLTNALVGFSMLYPALLFSLGLKRLSHLPEFSRPRRGTMAAILLPFAAATVLISEEFCFHALNVSRTESTISMELVGLVETQPAAGGPAGDEQSRFILILRNRSADTAALTPGACREPKPLPAPFRLSIIDWSALNQPVLMIPPGGAAWIRFEATRHGQAPLVPLEVECLVGGKSVSHQLTAAEIASAGP